jgi:hypothetical protein
MIVVIQKQEKKPDKNEDIHDTFCRDITAYKERRRAPSKWLTASSLGALYLEVMDWKTEGATLYKLFFSCV